MVTDVYSTVQNCSQGTHIGLYIKHHRQPELSPPAGTLEFAAIKIHGLLLRSNTGNQFAVINTDRYNKLTRATPTAKIPSTQVEHIFIHDWVIAYDLSDVVLSDNGKQFVSRIFTLLFTYLGDNKLTIHRQANGQVVRYNKTSVSRLRLYVADNQQYWDLFVQTITYEYNY